ncbi:MAG: Crp/Fnr family transcriptional regulator [Solirubrobacterales bacterium]|nr:Crp/Fnr family transcriptional regulator [Solirubrobacterales bacterium]
MSVESTRVSGAPLLGQGLRARLLDVEPDLVRFLPAHERASLEQLEVPVVTVPERTLELDEFLRERDAFAAIVSQGMLLHSLQIGSQPALRLLGPGEVVAVRDGAQSTLYASCVWRAAGASKLALLGGDVLLAMRQAPRLAIELQVRAAEQTERLATQMTICQLPRVEDRVLAVLWLLAESWGRVTPTGTILPLALTHEILGALVGARRPTVTLAVGELAERGAVIHQDRGWLLLEHPAAPNPASASSDRPRLLDERGVGWTSEPSAPGHVTLDVAPLSDTVKDLAAQYARNLVQVKERLRHSAVVRDDATRVRQRIRSRRALTRPRPPSS